MVKSVVGSVLVSSSLVSRPFCRPYLNRIWKDVPGAPAVRGVRPVPFCRGPAFLVNPVHRGGPAGRTPILLWVPERIGVKNPRFVVSPKRATGAVPLKTHREPWSPGDSRSSRKPRVPLVSLLSFEAMVPSCPLRRILWKTRKWSRDFLNGTDGVALTQPDLGTNPSVTKKQEEFGIIIQNGSRTVPIFLPNFYASRKISLTTICGHPGRTSFPLFSFRSDLTGTLEQTTAFTFSKSSEFLNR